MLVEPHEFIEESKKIGCTKEEFFTCADSLTGKLDLVEYIKSIGQDVYYVIDYQHHVLAVVTVGNKKARETPVMYSEVFKTLKHLSH